MKLLSLRRGKASDVLRQRFDSNKTGQTTGSGAQDSSLATARPSERASEQAKKRERKNRYEGERSSLGPGENAAAAPRDSNLHERIPQRI